MSLRSGPTIILAVGLQWATMFKAEMRRDWSSSALRLHGVRLLCYLHWQITSNGNTALWHHGRRSNVSPLLDILPYTSTPIVRHTPRRSRHACRTQVDIARPLHHSVSCLLMPRHPLRIQLTTVVHANHCATLHAFAHVV